MGWKKDITWAGGLPETSRKTWKKPFLTPFGTWINQFTDVCYIWLREEVRWQNVSALLPTPLGHMPREKQIPNLLQMSGRGRAYVCGKYDCISSRERHLHSANTSLQSGRPQCNLLSVVALTFARLPSPKEKPAPKCCHMDTSSGMFSSHLALCWHSWTFFSGQC